MHNSPSPSPAMGTYNGPDVYAVIEAAESRALALHDAGLCHLSEWSCSFCEVAA